MEDLRQCLERTMDLHKADMGLHLSVRGVSEVGLRRLLVLTIGNLEGDRFPVMVLQGQCVVPRHTTDTARLLTTDMVHHQTTDRHLEV